MVCRFFPEFVLQGGTMKDFIYAIRSTEGGQDPSEIILCLRDDWQKFLELVSKIGRTDAVNMAEINSILSQKSLSIWPYISGVPLKKTHIDAVMKWPRRPSEVTSLTRTIIPCTDRKISVSEIKQT